jgi:carboxyl-terminal processing protease
MRNQMIRSVAMGVVIGVGLAVVFAAGFLLRDVLPLARFGVASGSEYPRLAEVEQLVDAYYLREMPSETEQEYAVIRGFLAGLGDRNTIFNPPLEARLESDALAGVYGGIGAAVQKTTIGAFRLSPYPDSPAISAGLLDGDLILEINGVPVDQSRRASEIEVQLRGEVKDDSGVTLTVERDGQPQESIFIAFDIIQVPSVLSRVLDEDSRIGYVRITTFTGRTPEEFREAVTALTDAGIQALVLDLRDNGGGLLNEALDIAGEFLDGGLLMLERTRSGEKPFEDEAGGVALNLPTVLLVNGGTASASEIVAGSLQDTGRATMIGQKTYGKGTVQQVLELSDKSSVHITSSEWLTPNGRTIDSVGLEPEIPMIAAADGTDVELAEALRVLDRAIAAETP